MATNGCVEFFEDYPDSPNCCMSCHDDWDDGFDEPFDYDAPNGKRYYLCCSKSNYIDDELDR